jgi:DNA polymerase-3 subunit delta'
MSSPPPHPRDTFDWLGEPTADLAFADAWTRGRLHHAWLITGPPGVGKATFAYRVARRLLGARAAPQFGPLGAAPDDPVSRQIAARAMPDLMVVQTDLEDGKSRRFIRAEEAREAPEFFAKTPAAAPYRVAIIDAADDMNGHAANGLLKILEEPPARGVLLLISHAPGRLLATLRSRCRRLAIAPPPASVTDPWLRERAQVSEREAARLIDMARGAPGAAWALAQAGALDVDDAAQALVRSLPKADRRAVLSLADSFRGAAGAARFALFFERLAEHVRRRAQAQADDPDQRGAADRLAGLWSVLADTPRRVEGINLDRAETLHDVVSRLSASL